MTLRDPFRSEANCSTTGFTDYCCIPCPPLSFRKPWGAAEARRLRSHPLNLNLGNASAGTGNARSAEGLHLHNRVRSCAGPTNGAGPMNIRQKPENLIPQSVTCGPLAGSRKIYFEPPRRASACRCARSRWIHPPTSRRCASTTPRAPIRKTDAADRSRRRACRACAHAWYRQRASFETYHGPRGQAGGQRQCRRATSSCRPARPMSRRCAARDGKPVTQYEFARAGIITEEMIYVAARENLGREKMLGGRRKRSSPTAKASARRSRLS